MDFLRLYCAYEVVKAGANATAFVHGRTDCHGLSAWAARWPRVLQ